MIPALLPNSLQIHDLRIILGIIFDDFWIILGLIFDDFGVIFGGWRWKHKETTKNHEKIEPPTPLGDHLGANMAHLGTKLAPRWCYVGQLGAQDGHLEAILANM